jgi:serine/threonine protein kinase
MTTILPTFEFNELLLGSLLGRGGFCQVHEVGRFALRNNNKNNNNSEDDDIIKQQQSARLFIAQHCLRRQESCVVLGYCCEAPRYAVKRPCHIGNAHKNVQNDNDEKTKKAELQAIQDLVSETHFLRQLEHPHIIKLRGVSVGVATAVAARGNDDGARHPSVPLSTISAGFSPYFLVLDRLYDTLHMRIRSQWKPRLEQEYKKHAQAMRRHQVLSLLGFRPPVPNGDKTSKATNTVSRSKTVVFLRERLQVALDLAAALEYLHVNKQIWHRDIKPDNLGFDIRGHVKIFDFGLAKKQPSIVSNINNNDNNDSFSAPLFLATKMVGTLRYMAPEVGLGQRYNAKCDSYSFVHVLWEMLTCQKPYVVDFENVGENKITLKSFERSVWIGNTRPPLVQPPSTKHLPWAPLTQATVDILQGGWHADVHHRWTMSTIKSKLQEEVLRLKRIEKEDTYISNAHSNTACESSEQSSLPTYNRRRSTFVFCRCSSKRENDDKNNKHHSTVTVATTTHGNTSADDATRSAAANSIGWPRRTAFTTGTATITSTWDEESSSPSVEI